MAEGSVNYPFQSAVQCQICERHEDALWYCQQCKGRLCTVCRDMHPQLGKIFTSHRIIPLTEALQQQRAREEEEDCSLHEAYSYTLLCDDCQVLVCAKCITLNLHRGHALTTIQDGLCKVHRELHDFNKTLKTTLQKQIEPEIAKIEKQAKECHSWYDHVEDEVNKRRSEVKNEVDIVCDNLLSEAAKDRDNKVSDISKLKEGLLKQTEVINAMLNSSEEILTESNSKKIQYNKEKPNIAEINIPQCPSVQFCSFVPTITDRNIITEQVGTLQGTFPAIQVSKTSTSTPELEVCNILTNRGYLCSVICIDRQKTWISDYSSGKITLVSTTGQELKTIITKYKIDNFTSTPVYGNIIATDFFGGCIRVISQGGHVTQSLTTSPADNPTGICMDRKQQNIIVCTDNINVPCSKLVVLGNNDFTVKKTITYSKGPLGEDRQRRVVQNEVGDFCIVHRGHKLVYVLDNMGSLKFKYNGSRTREMRKPFSPYDLCSDINDHLLITDNGNHAIHMLDHKGKFLRYLLTKTDGLFKPTGLDVDMEGKLWIAQDNGDLLIVKYVKNKETRL